MGETIKERRDTDEKDMILFILGTAVMLIFRRGVIRLLTWRLVCLNTHSVLVFVYDVEAMFLYLTF